ncbi:MAG: hypothetical protein K0S08_1053 [Gammaproteobacteria bacterium]|jgi:hypothetical protein|nr:hypothetical protein [Gammaproteobacteria bacterium]
MDTAWLVKQINFMPHNNIVDIPYVGSAQLRLETLNTSDLEQVKAYVRQEGQAYLQHFPTQTLWHSNQNAARAMQNFSPTTELMAWQTLKNIFKNLNHNWLLTGRRGILGDLIEKLFQKHFGIYYTQDRLNPLFQINASANFHAFSVACMENCLRYLNKSNEAAYATDFLDDFEQFQSIVLARS